VADSGGPPAHGRRAGGASPPLRVLTGYPNLMPSYGGLLNLGGQNLQLKSTFNAKNFARRLVCLHPVISMQFTLEMCAAARNRKKSLKPPIFGFIVV